MIITSLLIVKEFITMTNSSTNYICKLMLELKLKVFIILNINESMGLIYVIK